MEVPVTLLHVLGEVAVFASAGAVGPAAAAVLLRRRDRLLAGRHLVTFELLAALRPSLDCQG